MDDTTHSPEERCITESEKTLRTKVSELDTPSLLIDADIMLDNVKAMQKYADSCGVSLRPHTKTHKMPFLADVQARHGCRGITTAKGGEAEVMIDNGIKDVFIANEIVGKQKLQRLERLTRRAHVSWGIDSPEQVRETEEAFSGSDRTAEVLIEIEVGENRSGIIDEAGLCALFDALRQSPHVKLRGVFSHEGHCYSVPGLDACRAEFLKAQKRTLHFASLAQDAGFDIDTVSIGSTPSLIHGFPVLPGITEIRPGTYILMDASMASAAGTLEHCAATVLATVISRPTAERVILDVGAKGITMQRRTEGISAVRGLGTIKGFKDVYIDEVYDEHAIIYSRSFRDAVKIGDKVEIIPVHICPVCNLYEAAYLVSDGYVLQEIPVLCRGKLQ